MAEHPGLRGYLASKHPVSRERVDWPLGPLEMSLYLGVADLPDELVTSVRCIVRVGGGLLVCEDATPSVGIWPGGRREPGESWEQTAVREVAEETGCVIEPASLVMVGFLHFRHLAAVPTNHPYPHPDFLQVILHGEATGGPVGWVDSEGYVLRSYAVELQAVDALPISAAERLAVAAAMTTA